jgi:hypothetical protein
MPSMRFDRVLTSATCPTEVLQDQAYARVLTEHPATEVGPQRLAADLGLSVVDDKPPPDEQVEDDQLIWDNDHDGLS